MSGQASNTGASAGANREGQTDIDALLASLSLREKAALTAGADMWTVPGLPEHGVPAITVTDGPNGARGSALLGAGRVTAACLPCGTALGATWDPALVEEVGQVLGEEARTKGARVLLAPTINLHRHPLGGRGFECYSEDPLLSGKVAAGFVRGVQSRGVAATAKHFVANEQEHERTTISSVVEERVLRELYCAPFEVAIKEAGLLAVMTSYNRLNGVWCSEDRALLEEVLRGDLGFDGIVMTDWFAVGSTLDSARGGLDLQMPGPDRFYGAPLAKAVEDGDLEPEALDGIARRWLQLIDRLDAWQDRPLLERAVDLPEHREVARRASAAGTVLLRNDGVLPLLPAGTVALVGPLAARAHLMGGGSAQLRPHRAPSLLDVLAPQLGDRLSYARGSDIDKTVRALATPGTRLDFYDSTDLTGPVHSTSVESDLKLLWFGSPEPGLDENAFSFRATAMLAVHDTGTHTFTLVQAGRARLILDGKVLVDGVKAPPAAGTDFFGLGSQEAVVTADLVAGTHVEVVVEYSADLSQYLHGVKIGHRPPAVADPIGEAVAVARAADVAVVVVGTSEEWESEGHDRTTMSLPGDQDELVRRVCAANPRTVVVVCAGAPVDLSCAEQAAAVLLPWLGGQEVSYALDDVLFGRAEPSGRLPVSFPRRIEHAPAFGSFPGENDEVVYREGLFIGYRWYDSRHLPVRFPFGHGGSYTYFEWGKASLSASTYRRGDEVVLTVPVTNTGERRGAEVVQVYVRPGRSRLVRPRSELRGFAKVELDPGETRDVTVVLRDRAFAYWDAGSTDRGALRERLGEGSVVPADQGPEPRTAGGWWIDEGPVEVVVARSVEDVVEVLPLEVVSGGPVDRSSCP
ncbi:MAG: glycoside hydrolase family 3 C-terminal domain-containing protein [Actinomycetota bacterium]|nr:glycoside hydrolase family 3 C-terminal domain-containing protein [Actinomycetota bacterium]